MNLLHPYDLKKQSMAIRSALVLGVNIAYALGFTQLYPAAGEGLNLLAIVPAAVGGWLLGWLLGLQAGLLTGLLNLSLHYIVAEIPFPELLNPGWPALVAITAGGGLAGWLSDLLQQLKEQTGDLIFEREALREETVRRQQTEESLRRMQDRYALATQAAGVGVWDWNIQTGEFYLDPNVKALLGYTDEEIPNDLDTWTAYVHPADRQAVMTAAQAHLDNGTPEYLFEHRMLHKDGSNRWILVRGTAIRDAQGQAVRFLGTDTDITQRKQAEEALRESEARFRDAFEYATTGLALASTEGRLLQVNNAFCRMFGYSASELEQLNFQAITHPADLEQSLISLRQILTGESDTLQIEKRYIHKEGHTVWAILNLSLLRNHQAQPLHFITQVQDIIERKQIEMERLQFINQLQTAADVSKHINAILDPDLLLHEVVTLLRTRFDLYHVHIYLLNETGTELIMRVGSGERGKRLREQEHKIPLHYKQSLVAQAARNREIVLVNETRAEPNFLANPFLPETRAEVAAPIITANRLLGVLDVQDNRPNRFNQSDLDTFSTLSGEIAIALENARLFAKSKQTEAVLRLRDRAIKASSNGILIVDAVQPDQPVIFVNPAFEQITGYTAAETIGRNCRFLQGEEKEQPALDELRAAIREGRNCTVVLRNYRKDGGLFWNQLSISPIYNETQEKLTHFVGVQVDITERKEAEKALTYARDQALEASRLKTQILAKVSHELRTPLNAILGFAEMLEFGTYGPISAEQREATSKIIDSTTYLAGVVGELLDQARLDNNKLQLAITFFAPEDIVRRVKTETSVLAQAKGLTLTTTIDPDVPETVLGDPARVQQILSNLVSNAIKFTEQGCVRVRLYCPDETTWAMKVSDTGPGIPAEAQATIFEPFQQLDGSLTRLHSGYGLGLSIVKQLTLLMDGRVKLKSKVGQGSTFTVSLPLPEDNL